MKLVVPKGKYLVAVSGGVDSVVLLDMVSKLPNLEIVVAHFNHGIRKEAGDDAAFVEKLAAQYGYAYVAGSAELGAGASEAVARVARYAFLESSAHHREALVMTAHHQDDLLETMILNMLRGTGRRGLTPFTSRPEIIRPLLEYSKIDLLTYAHTHQLAWHEDVTNTDESYRRNWVRAQVMPLLHEKRAQLLEAYTKSLTRNQEIDSLLQELDGWLLDDGGVVRARFVSLPFAVATEWTHQWLTLAGVPDISRERIVRTVLAIKTLKPNKKFPLGKQFWLQTSAHLVKIVAN